ncbi:hypothetical protein HOG98_04360 [bacterium]|jgi:hypothetical protein|nr:hypothetical protein [bacterium]
MNRMKNKASLITLSIVKVLLLSLLLSGCTLLDDSNEYVFEDFSSELSSISTYTKQIFTSNPLYVEPTPTFSGTLNETTTNTSYTIVDIFDFSTVTGVQTITFTENSVSGDITTENYTETVSIAPDAGTLTIEKLVEKVTTEVSPTENTIVTTVSGNISISPTASIVFGFENILFESTIENDVDGSSETLSSLSITSSLPFTITYNSTVLTGTLTGSQTNATSALTLSGDIKKEGESIGSLSIKWDAYDDFKTAAPLIIVRDQKSEIVSDL